MVPPSTRKAAPVVADASGLTRYATSAAISFVVAKRLINDVGRTFSKNSLFARVFRRTRKKSLRLGMNTVVNAINPRIKHIEVTDDVVTALK